MRRTLAVALLLVVLAGPALGGATLLPNGEQTFVDANGAPISGGRVYFYIPNTLTPKTTWSTQSQSAPNTNPVVLDSAGRAVIYGVGMYRQILKDQAGNLIWDKLTQGFGDNGQTINATIAGSATVAACSGVFPISNGTGATLVVTMPTAPTAGDTCAFLDAGNNAAANTIRFNFGAKPLTNGQTVLSLNENSFAVQFTFLGTTWGVQ